MNVESLSNSQAWARFLSVTEAARARNTGFTAPVKKTQQTIVRNTLSNVPAAASIRQTGVVASASQLKQPGKVLGTLFDAYA